MECPENPGLLSPREKLKRFLYTTSIQNTFVAGNPESRLQFVADWDTMKALVCDKEKNKAKLDKVTSPLDFIFLEFLSLSGDKDNKNGNFDQFVNILKEASCDNLLIRRRFMFYLLAQALTFLNRTSGRCKEGDDMISKIKQLILDLSYNDQDFFNFVKYASVIYSGNKKMDKKEIKGDGSENENNIKPKQQQTKMSTSIRKLALNFYKNMSEKSDLDFATMVMKRQSQHGWSHKDLIKLTHFKSQTVSTNVIVNFILFGPQKLPEDSKDDFVTLLKKSHDLRTSEEVEKVVSLINEMGVSDLYHEVNSKLNKNEEIWFAFLSNMTPRQVLKSLHKFYKLGFLKGNFQNKVVEVLVDATKIKSCQLHPIQVYIYQKFFEKGGRLPDPKLKDFLKTKGTKEEVLKKISHPPEPKANQFLLQNINKCLKMSYANFRTAPMNQKRILVTFDTREKTDQSCFQNRHLTCLEAAYAIVKYLSTVAKHVTVAVFKDNLINQIDLKKCFTSEKAVEQLKEHECTYALQSAPIDFALSKKRQFDVFVNFCSAEHYQNLPKENSSSVKALTKYRETLKLPNTRWRNTQRKNQE